MKPVLLLVLASCAASSQPTARPSARPVEEPPRLVPAAPASLLPTTVVAALPDREITLAELDRRIGQSTRDELASLPEVERDYRLAQERIRILDELIDAHLLMSLEPGLKGKVEGAPDEVDKAMAAVRTELELTEAQFEELVTKGRVERRVDHAASKEIIWNRGTSIAEYREELRRHLVIARIVGWFGKDLPGTTVEKRAALVKRLRAATRIRTDLTLPPIPARAPILDASVLVTASDLAVVLKRPVPELETGVLADEPATATYASWHFRAKTESEAFDLAVRIWRVSDPATRYKQLQTDLPRVSPWGKLASQSFTAEESGIMAVGFLDQTSRAVVLVTCGRSLCSSVADVQAVATLYHQRLDRLPR